MKKVIIDLLISTITFLVFDLIWIGIIMNSRYNDLVKKIQGEEISFNFIPAILCYILLIGGLYNFSISIINRFDIKKILYSAVPYGLATYGTYDFTSAAILKDFDIGTAFIDLAWGTFLVTIVSCITIYSRIIHSPEPDDDADSRIR